MNGTTRRTVTVDGVEFRAFPEHGAYFGVTEYRGRPCLLGIAMLESGEPAPGWPGDDEPYNVTEISCIEDDDDCLDAINAEFGTHFKREDFPGR